MPKFKQIGLFAGAILLAFVTAIILTGVLTSLSANVIITNLEVYFDPQITIAYMLVAYFLSHYFSLTGRQSFWTFITALFLSYTTIFMQGSIFLIFVLALLKKFNLLAAKE